MAKEYRPYGLEQAYLLPQAPREWLPEGHLALFLEDAVSLLDIEEIAVRFKRGRGPRAYHPRMLLSLLLYGYCTGVYSSRKIAAACETDVAFRALCGGQFPDFRTVSDFRKNHLEVFAGLFIQVLGMCREAGLVKMGHLSLDGSKYQANASKHKAMSYQRIQETEPRLEAEIAELLRRAAEIDEAEDAEYGHDARGDELPEGREVYARRKVITEPVHGLTKHVRGFRQFLLRGIHKVAGEFTLVSLTHNLLKLWRANPVAAGSSNPA